MSVKAKVEAIIYATEEPVSLNQLASLLRDSVLTELRAENAARLALNEVISDDKPERADEASDEVAPAAQADQASQPDDEQEKEFTKRVKAHLAQVLDEL